MIKFGTDGIRGKVNLDFTERDAFLCGEALKDQNIIIGCDTRFSSEKLKFAFSMGCKLSGSRIYDLGIAPTAMVAYLTKKMQFDFGVVITASHNPYIYNGIKFFDKNGEKISSRVEKRIEGYVNSSRLANYGYYSPEKLELVDDYATFLINSIPRIKKKKVVLDCANGALYNIASYVFGRLGMEVILINCCPNGENINLRCGATCLTGVRKIVIETRADIGFAFDGDGDRVVAVDRSGRIYNGDLILYVLAKHFGIQTVVGTKLTNIGVERALQNQGGKLIRANIGDKFVNEMLKKHNLTLGGEPAGHIVLRDYLSTGDGLLSALKILEATQCCDLADYIDFKPYPSKLGNIYASDTKLIIQNEKFCHLKQKLRRKLIDGRILVRPSGTESCVRILVEDRDSKVANGVCKILADCAKSIINNTAI